MEIKEIGGIDIAKKDFVIHLYKTNDQHLFNNTPEGFIKMYNWCLSKDIPMDNFWFVLENTGLYSHLISIFFTEKKCNFSVISGLEIKRSMGVVRGKTDVVDAYRISLYGYRCKEELKQTILPKTNLLKIKALYSMRSKLVIQRKGHAVRHKEQKNVFDVKEFKYFFKMQKDFIAHYDKQITLLEKQIKSLIAEDESLKQNMKLVKSVKGIGDQTAIALLIYTNNFTKFKDARKFASFCGIAPFHNQSGTSIRGKTKVSSLANKKVKSLLDMCAKSVIQCDVELQDYYQKKLAEKKPKMLALNAVKNKLVARAFAVVKRQTPYVNTCRFAS